MKKFHFRCCAVVGLALLLGGCEAGLSDPTEEDIHAVVESIWEYQIEAGRLVVQEIEVDKDETKRISDDGVETIQFVVDVTFLYPKGSTTGRWIDPGGTETRRVQIDFQATDDGWEGPDENVY